MVSLRVDPRACETKHHRFFRIVGRLSNAVTRQRTYAERATRPSGRSRLPRSDTMDEMSASALPTQPIDATHELNRSAGVSKSNVFLGRSFSCRATALSFV